MPAAQNQSPGKPAFHWMLWSLAGVCIFCFIVLLGHSFWLWAWTQGAMDAGSFIHSHSFSLSTAGPPQDLQKTVDAAVDASIKREELVLDKLLLVVGLYSTILSILAMATVIFSRQDAKEQLDSFKTKSEAQAAALESKLTKIESDAKTTVDQQLTGLVGKFDALASDLEKKLAKIEDEARMAAREQLTNVDAKADALASRVEGKIAEIRIEARSNVEELKAQVRAEFPSISRLQERLQGLILELEDRFPEDENLYRQRPDTWQTELKQQNSLIDESKILAVSVVALDAANLLKLYLALARFYFDRFNTGSFTEGDAARSYVYASRAIKDNPMSADAFRTRGATTLARYDALSKIPARAAEAHDLLPLARIDFNRCIELDPHSAGAFYNLALVSSYEYKFKKKDKPDEANQHLDRAIQVSESLLAVKDDVPRKAKEKYLPDVYINLACLITYKVASWTQPAEKSGMYDRIVKICTEGKDYLVKDVKSSKANDNFKRSLERELGAGGDFAGLPSTARKALEDLFSGSWDEPLI